jgi:hypothetical protein
MRVKAGIQNVDRFRPSSRHETSVSRSEVINEKRKIIAKHRENIEMKLKQARSEKYQKKFKRLELKSKIGDYNSVARCWVSLVCVFGAVSNIRKIIQAKREKLAEKLNLQLT